MTDLEKEMLRQIHELDQEIKTLRERVAVLEHKVIQPYQPGMFTYVTKTGQE